MQLTIPLFVALGLHSIEAFSPSMIVPKSMNLRVINRASNIPSLFNSKRNSCRVAHTTMQQSATPSAVPKSAAELLNEIRPALTSAWEAGTAEACVKTLEG